MYLDLITISAANVAVAAVLAGMLLLTRGRDGWSLEAALRFVGSWGLVALVFSLGGMAMLMSAVWGVTGGLIIGATQPRRRAPRRGGVRSHPAGR
jgi:hypothetical protein